MACEYTTLKNIKIYLSTKNVYKVSAFTAQQSEIYFFAYLLYKETLNLTWISMNNAAGGLECILPVRKNTR